MRSLALLTLCIAPSLASAQAVTLSNGTDKNGVPVANFVFNTANAVKTVTLSGGAAAMNGGGTMAEFHTNDVSGVGLPASGLRATSLRCVLNPLDTDACNSTGTTARFITLDGTTGNRQTLAMSWGTDGSGNALGALNGSGFDLFSIEWSNNEGYRARFQTSNGAWTNWGYTAAQIGYKRNDPNVPYYGWLTQFDFSDYGVAGGALVTGIEFQNVLPADGYINPQTGNEFQSGGISPFFTASDITPDLFYVGSVNGLTTVPEPSSFVLAFVGMAGIAGLGRLRKRV
jgi:hypothetical protein